MAAVYRYGSGMDKYIIQVDNEPGLAIRLASRIHRQIHFMFLLSICPLIIAITGESWRGTMRGIYPILTWKLSGLTIHLLTAYRI